jgi:uncharacterized protein (DUF1778 family)
MARTDKRQLVVYLKESEYQLLSRLAAMDGRSRSNFVVQLVLKAKAS